MTLFDQEEVKARVLEAWEATFQASNRVISQAKIFGFSCMEVIPDPNIHQIINTLRVLERFLETIIDSQIFGDLHYDETRRILNAREQIRRMEKVAIALQTDDGLMFDQAIEELEQQAAF